MEQRTRKARGNIQSTNRSSYPSSNKPPMSGMYNDEALVAEVTSLLGCVVEVTTLGNVVYEGVLKVLSPDMAVILELAHNKTEKLSHDNVQKSLELQFCNIVNVTAKASANPSLEQKEGLRLDRDISSGSGSSADRELQRFTDFEESENAVLTLGLDGSGWRPEEMWRENVEKFNVQSTYDESLVQYTTPLERTNSEEFKRKEARAKRLAAEIENKQDWPALNENFDSTEEERFSSVADALSYANTPSSSGKNSKPIDTSVGTDVSVVRMGGTTEPQQLEPVNEALVTQKTEAGGLHNLHVNGGAEHSVHGTDEEEGKTKEEVIRAFQLNPSAKEFTPTASAKEFTPLEFVSPPNVQSPIISPPSQSSQAFYSPNKRPFSTFQKPRPRTFISPDPTIPMAPSGFIYQNPGVALSPQPLARPFVPGSMVMPGPYAMSGIMSPQQQLMSGKMVEFFPPHPPVLTAMGQMATQPQHYIGHLGQPGQPFSASPQMIQANQQMFYLQQGTVPNFVPTQQVMPQQFLMLPRK